MAQKFLNRQQAAEALGVSIDQINAMRERNQLHGYRDGADWKFKAEDVERLAAELKAAAPPPEEPQAAPPEEIAAEPKDSGDVLLSEVELGQSSVSTSGTVIGLSEEPGESDISSPTLTGFEDLDLTLERDTKLSQNVPSEVPIETKPQPAPSSGSTVDLMADLEDDDLVLSSSSSGSGSGSDITIGGDSGISLVDPTDSGLSLEEPLDLVGGSREALTLAGDSAISLFEGGDTESPTQLKSGSDFTLTPMVEGTEDEESGSGSQVIALDDEQGVAGVATGSGPMPPMLDEELGGELGLGAGLAAAPVGVSPEYAAAQAAQPAAVLPELPYTTWNIVSLSFCAFFLFLAGMMMFDLLRNMWSWGTPYHMNSWLMDAILSIFGK